MHSAMVPRWQQRRSRPSHGHSGHWRAGSISWPTSSAADPPPPLNWLRRSPPRCVAMDLLGDAARDCANRSTASRPCQRSRGRRDYCIAVGPCSRLEQSPQPPRSPQRGWPQRWRSEPARRRVNCRAIDISSGSPRVEQRSRDSRPAVGGRRRARSGAACWRERAASEPLDDFLPGGWEGTRRRRRS